MAYKKAREGEHLSFKKVRLSDGYMSRCQALVRERNRQRALEKVHSVNLLDSAAIRVRRGDENEKNGDEKPLPISPITKLQQSEHIPQHMELGQVCLSPIYEHLSAKKTLSRMEKVDAATEMFLLPASVTTLLVPLPPFRVAHIGDTLTGEQVLGILLDGMLSKMLNSVQEKRQLSNVGLDVAMALDRGWAANFTALPTQATSRCNGQSIDVGAIKSSGLEMATSEVPNLPPYLPMHFLGYGEVHRSSGSNPSTL